jgi:hypothetical protein
VPASSGTDLGFPAALTLAGNNVDFEGYGSTNFAINGNEPAANACATASRPAIGYTNASDSSRITSGETAPGKYTGSPSIQNVNDSHAPFMLSPTWQRPSGLDAVVQAITRSADVVVTGPATQADLPSAMAATNPMTTVVNGDLTFNSWRGTGYGVLLVTGTFYYDPDASWNGIILVIGQGKFISTKPGSGQLRGAVFVAQTRDSSGNLLPDPNLGSASFIQTGGGTGIQYDSCWINGPLTGKQFFLRGPLLYRVLSFRER